MDAGLKDNQLKLGMVSQCGVSVCDAHLLLPMLPVAGSWASSL